MKKITYIFLFLLGLYSLQLDVLALNYSNPGSVTPQSIRGGGPNRVTRCNSNAVPQDSQTNLGSDAPVGSFNCRTHNYYAPSTYQRATNSSGITLCNAEDRVTGISGSNIVCTRWDDGAPTVNPSTIAYSRHNIWTNSNGTVSFGANDVNTSSTNGTVRSGINTTRYCWGSSCNLSSPTSGTAANSVVVNTQQDRVLRYRSWDNNGNSSTIGFVRVQIDKTDPIVQYLNHTDGWINNTSQTVTFRLTDGGGSNLSRYTLQQRSSSNNPNFTSAWSGWSNVSGHTNRSISGSNHIGSYTYNGSNHTAYEFRIRVWDEAGNSSSNTNSGERTQIDITPPAIANVSNNVPANLLATNSYSYSISVDQNGGSPIDSVRYRRENHNNNALSGDINDTSPPWQFNWNISLVDNYRIGNGSREYTYSIRRICDEAGNCWSGVQNYNHNVYPNTLSINSSVVRNELSTTILADGVAKDIEIQLADAYGNAIIPASGIGRNIDLNFSVNNQLFLDQYRNSGSDTALYGLSLSRPIGIGVSTQQYNNRPSGNGEYTVPFYIYAPTQIADNRVRGVASITGLSYDIDASTQILSGDRPQNQSVSGFSNTAISATPLYSTTMSGGLTQQGFLEGAIQDLDLYVSNRGVSTSNNSLRVEFGDVDASDQNISNSRYRFTINGTSIAEGPQSSWSNTTQLSSSLSNQLNRSTFMIQDGSVSNETFSYLASIIKHDVGSGSARRTVVYPSDVFGKDAYIGPAGENNSYQEGAKILGNTSSSSKQELTEDQFVNDIRIIGEVTKSTLRRDISKNIYEVIKNIPNSELSNGAGNVTNLRNVNAWNTSGNNGKRIFGNQVLYFRGQDVEVTADTIQGNKTLLVEDGDIYISGNITGPGTLGIVALGGDILIRNTVTDIHAILYTDKSIFSTIDGVNKLDGNTPASTLSDQLYIKGSLFSENTIGGSRKTVPECPYYVLNNCTTQSQAQAYDLNYLRRYFIYDASDPRDGIPETPSGNQSTTAPSGNEQYPVVIDYNPVIQTDPPPFF